MVYHISGPRPGKSLNTEAKYESLAHIPANKSLYFQGFLLHYLFIELFTHHSHLWVCANSAAASHRACAVSDEVLSTVSAFISTAAGDSPQKQHR